MCLALPAKIISIETSSDTAMVALEGVKKEISLALVDDVAVGDYVLVHVGYALNTVSEEEAEKTLELMSEAGIIGEGTAEDAA